MKLKRLISWLLASALAASLAVMPIGAAGTSPGLIRPEPFFLYFREILIFPSAGFRTILVR